MAIMTSILIAASLAAQAPGRAPDWRPLGEIEGMTISWDAAGTERGDTVIARVRFMRVGERPNPYSYSVSRIEIRCDPGQAHAIETVNYYPDGRPGATDREVGPFIRIEPGTFFATLQELVC